MNINLSVRVHLIFTNFIKDNRNPGRMFQNFTIIILQYKYITLNFIGYKNTFKK